MENQTIRALLSKINRAWSNPVQVAYGQWGRWFPASLFARYQDMAVAAGLDRVYFILSFDCDTPEDVEVVWSVHSRLLDMGICPDYAVPGELLLSGEKTYRRIRETGARFLNHGYYMHAWFDPDAGEFRSCFFYDQLPLTKIQEDVRRGDACLREVMGEHPEGFRAPHFGTFQKPHQIRFLHDLLRELGYRFSSSTMPQTALQRGPVIRVDGLWEIPVSGMASAPTSIFDTWGFFRAPNRQRTPLDYGVEGHHLAERYAGFTGGLLNIYGDPCHIHDAPIFFATMDQLAKMATPITFQHFLDRITGTNQEPHLDPPDWNEPRIVPGSTRLDQMVDSARIRPTKTNR
ncbi:MAG: hypothetical protein H7833_15845 [Magnetococcus sp. DMHC-1]|nr:polysaccharide deacetylase [Magnetococcales bacterium]